MFKIFCDETWTNQSEYKNVKKPYIVFYGIMIEFLSNLVAENRQKAVSV